ncbi:6810_t:CDS:2 [Rhizophagus irregularis]|nr:6810_t:CDS:2 [Rhizophagus irregularis]
MRLRSKRDSISLPSKKRESCSTTPVKESLEQITIGSYYYVTVKNNLEDEQNYRVGKVLAVKFSDDNVPEYYITYAFYNRRLDEWVKADQIDTKREIDIKLPKKRKIHQDNAISDATAMIIEDSQDDFFTTSGIHVKNKFSQGDSFYSQESFTLQIPVSSEVNDYSGSNFICDEVPNLRCSTPSSSITYDSSPCRISSSPKIVKSQVIQNNSQITSGGMNNKPIKIRVKNIKEIQIGEDLIEPWYFSPYPEEFKDAPIVYICEFCLSYYMSEFQFKRHKTKCNLFHPPGNQIYKDEVENLAVFEIDGERQQTYCYGRFLIAFSYTISKMQDKVGAPEEPLSDLGLLTYQQYWIEAITELLLKANEANEEISIDDIAYQTGIAQKDVQYTLHLIGICIYLGHPCIKISSGLMEMAKNSKVKKHRTIKSECFDEYWEPPVYNPSHCRFLN